MVVYILCTIYRKREIEHPREFNLLPILLLTQNKDGVPSSLNGTMLFYPFLKWTYTDYSQFIGKGQIEYPTDNCKYALRKVDHLDIHIFGHYEKHWLYLYIWK